MPRCFASRPDAERPERRYHAGAWERAGILRTPIMPMLRTRRFAQGLMEDDRAHRSAWAYLP